MSIYYSGQYTIYEIIKCSLTRGLREGSRFSNLLYCRRDGLYNPFTRPCSLLILEKWQILCFNCRTIFQRLQVKDSLQRENDIPAPFSLLFHKVLFGRGSWQSEVCFLYFRSENLLGDSKERQLAANKDKFYLSKLFHKLFR